MNLSALTSGSSTSNDASTASISPAADAMVYVAVGVSVVGGQSTRPEDSMTVSGAGLTWTLVGSYKNWGSRRGIYVFRGTSASPSSGALTITFTSGGGTFESLKWSVSEATGVNTTTPEVSVLTNGEPLADLTSLATSGHSAPAAGDYVYSAIGIENNVSAEIAKSELATTLHNVSDATGCRTLEAAYDDTPDSTPAPGWTWTTPSGAGMVSFIIQTAGGATLKPRLSLLGVG